MIRRGAGILESLVDRATTTDNRFRSRMGGLVACLLVAFLVFVVARLFLLVGVWVIVAVGWLAIAVFVWRFRGNIEMSRLRDAVRNDRFIDPARRGEEEP